jgi:indole-3-glycerol phosphate synthase
MTFVETDTILDTILRRTAADVEARKEAVSARELERAATERATPVSLTAALRAPGVSVIAEFKRASPSKGRFPVEISPVEVVPQYLGGGAAALSVLTDSPFFQGSLDDLREAAGIAHAHTPPAPVLRKDFVLEEYQVLEAAAAGADAVLLIVAALDDAALRRLRDFTGELGLEALVEVHCCAELARAADAGATLIGINNRDLRTFTADLAVCERLAPLAPADAVVIGESGIFTRADVERLERAGVDAVLVGESLILAPDRAAAVRELRGEP